MSQLPEVAVAVHALVNNLQANANLDCYNRLTYYEIIDEWISQTPMFNYLKTQTCVAHPNNSGKVTNYKELYEKAVDSFVTLEEEYSKLKAQFLNRPNWDDVPVGTTIFRVFSEYVNENKSTIHNRVTLYEEQRPAPAVDVGQVWKLKNAQSSSIFKVMSIGSFNVANDECNGISIFGDGTTYFYSIEDFLNRFHRIGE
jgi:hypothetical protein